MEEEVKVLDQEEPCDLVHRVVNVASALQLDCAEPSLVHATPDLLNDGDACRAANTSCPGSDHGKEGIGVADAAGRLDLDVVRDVLPHKGKTSSTMAPPSGEKPVEVLTKLGFTSEAMWQRRIFSMRA